MKSNLPRYLYEIGHLKRVQRSGWSLAGIAPAESVAEHSFRAAVIAYLLAEMEGADGERAAAMALFHDVPEARVGDLHHLARGYVDWSGVEDRVLADQLSGLPPKLAARLLELSRERRAESSLEARLVKDADRLECLLQALEYAARGYDVEEWVRSSIGALKTDAAREVAEEALETPAGGWRRLRGEG